MKQLTLVTAVWALCFAAGAELRLGDPAPALEVAVIKGDAVDLAAGKGKNVYIVEFWATWCAPCKVSIPHLTEMQAKYKKAGLRIIGISTEDPPIVKPFVKDMGEKMEYTVAVDRDKKTHAKYMKAVDAPGIPYAFVIGKMGEVVWHGHPMDPFVNDLIPALLEEDVSGQLKQREPKSEAQPLGPPAPDPETKETEDK